MGLQGPFLGLCITSSQTFLFICLIGPDFGVSLLNMETESLYLESPYHQMTFSSFQQLPNIINLNFTHSLPHIGFLLLSQRDHRSLSWAWHGIKHWNVLVRIRLKNSTKTFKIKEQICLTRSLRDKQVFFNQYTDLNQYVEILKTYLSELRLKIKDEEKGVRTQE